jgi:hypothetical protein
VCSYNLYIASNKKKRHNNNSNNKEKGYKASKRHNSTRCIAHSETPLSHF